MFFDSLEVEPPAEATAAEAAAFLLDLLALAFGVAASAFCGVLSADADAVDEADDEDADDVGLRQVTVERDDGDGCPI